MNTYLEKPIPVNWIIKSDHHDAFTQVVGEIRSHGGVNRSVDRFCAIIPDVKLVSYDIPDRSFKVNYRSARNLYNVLTDWKYFYVQFGNGKEFDHLGTAQRGNLESIEEFYRYIRHYADIADTPDDSYIDLDDIVF